MADPTAATASSVASSCAQRIDTHHHDDHKSYDDEQQHEHDDDQEAPVCLERGDGLIHHPPPSSSSSVAPNDVIRRRIITTTPSSSSTMMMMAPPTADYSATTSHGGCGGGHPHRHRSNGGATNTVKNRRRRRNDDAKLDNEAAVGGYTGLGWSRSNSASDESSHHHQYLSGSFHSYSRSDDNDDDDSSTTSDSTSHSDWTGGGASSIASGTDNEDEKQHPPRRRRQRNHQKVSSSTIREALSVSSTRIKNAILRHSGSVPNLLLMMKNGTTLSSSATLATDDNFAAPLLPTTHSRNSSIPTSSSPASGGCGGMMMMPSSSTTTTADSHRAASETPTETAGSATSATTSSTSTSTTPSPSSHHQILSLLMGTAGIFVTYFYYGIIQEDLFRYRDPITNQAFTYVWFLQCMESSITILLGYLGRQYYTKYIYTSSQQAIYQKQCQHHTFPYLLFFQSGTCQLLGKVFMALSLSYGLSFPVVVLAKSAKVVPVMLGQFVIGGSHYSYRDYLFALCIVSGTALLSFGSSTTSASSATTWPNNQDVILPVMTHPNATSTTATADQRPPGLFYNDNRNTTLGLLFIIGSLLMDGVTGGLQKKMKRDTSHLIVSTYDFLFYSHCAMLAVSFLISMTTNELWQGHQFMIQQIRKHRDQLLVAATATTVTTTTIATTATSVHQHDDNHPNVLYLLLSSCVCSAIGQCFIFYVIAVFDPLVCTTITTTRKMASVLYSIAFKGHSLNRHGVAGLSLGLFALLIEMEQQYTKNKKSHNTNKIK